MKAQEHAESLQHSSWVRRVTHPPLGTNTYFVRSPTQNHCVVIDPGLDTQANNELLEHSGWKPKAVLCTHGHFDHIGGAAALQAQHATPVFILEADLKQARLANFMLAALKSERRISLPAFTFIHTPRQPLQLEGRRYLYHAFPGHTPGSALIEVDGLLFSGDSLYARRTALSRLPGEDHQALRQSLSGLLAWGADQLYVLPGHGSAALLGDIRRHNHELQEFLQQARPAGTP